ncbi:hypothetical protein R1sor_007705 [Riccia sorocarpa]|uniref:Ribosomal protein L14 n=1 Tax=Riccia sorocarpa TaxID=122646 RepID=A0ABD3HXJ8_9MARC
MIGERISLGRKALSLSKALIYDHTIQGKPWFFLQNSEVSRAACACQTLDMLRTVLRRACGVSPGPKSWSFPIGRVFGDGNLSSATLSEAFPGGKGSVLVDRSSGGDVLGQSSSSRLNCGRWIQTSTLECRNVLPSWTKSGSGSTQLNQIRGFVQLKTNLEVADNSGAKRVQCIKVMKGSNAAKIGDIIMASVKDAQPRGKVKKGEVVTCVVVRAATQKLRRDGSEIKFDKNAVVLINKQGEPIGTRIFGPVPHELRRRKLVKILTLADYVA